MQGWVDRAHSPCAAGVGRDASLTVEYWGLWWALAYGGRAGVSGGLRYKCQLSHHAISVVVTPGNFRRHRYR